MNATGGGLREAAGFLTVFGGSRTGSPTPWSLKWFPAVGGLLGAALGIVWWSLRLVLAPLPAAVVVVGCDLGATGMLHFDGLLDSADGLLPHLSPERRLEVMAEPQVGAYAVVVAVFALVARVGGLSAVTAGSWWRSLLLLGAIWTVGRSVMVIGAVRLRYARPGGIAAAFLGSGEAAERATTAAGFAGIGAVILSGVALWAWHAVSALPVLGFELLGAAAVLALGLRRIGGYTGDVLGAAGVVGETLALLAAAVKW